MVTGYGKPELPGQCAQAGAWAPAEYRPPPLYLVPKLQLGNPLGEAPASISVELLREVNV